MSGRRISNRERRVAFGAAAVALVAVVIGYVGVPFYRSWNDREERIVVASEQLARVASLIARQDILSKTVSDLERSSGSQRRVLTARTAALAASELQRIMRLHAERSRMSIDRLEFSSSDEAGDGGTAVIPFTVSAVGDIYGVTDFLAILRSESPVVEVAEVSLISNSALKAGLIQFSATVRAPVVIQ